MRFTVEVDVVDRLERYRRMLRIRGFEDRVAALYRDGEVPGFVHLSVGQEAVAVGATWPLGPDDAITSTHRGHGHVLARGLDLTAAFAELLGRETGACRGRGGSMHLADPRLGILGANGIVGAGLPIAAGAALAAQLRGRGGVVVAFFGDGAVAQGAFHEAANLAAVWRLPLVLCCENNHYAEFAHTSAQHPVGFAARAAGYGLPYHHVPGDDVEAVAAKFTEVVAAVRAGAGPVFVEAETHRMRGHYEGDPQRYRALDLDAAWADRDPLLVAATALGPVALEVAVEVESELTAALTLARAGARPDPAELHRYVLTDREEHSEPAAATGEDTRTSRLIRAALEYELAADPDVVIFGVDAGASGNVFGLTRGLHERWPDRVRDTPISETAVIGAGVGAAMAGLRPIVELMYLDFLGVCFDQLLNQAAKLRYMTGGATRLPLVVRTQFGAGRSSGAQHSQSLEALLAHIPGLTVVMPSTPADTYGLLRAAIRDDNPVVFIENRLLYERSGPAPPVDHLVPLGKARIARAGTDLTIVSWSRMVFECLAAAEILAGAGISAEVVDLRTIAPLDTATVLDSLARTNRLLIVHEAVTDFGPGAELAALAVDSGFWSLDAPVRRLGGPATPVPYAPELERAWLPDVARIVTEAKQLTHF